MSELEDMRRRVTVLEATEVEHKQMEIELEKYRPYLEELVEERTERLHNAQEELERILDLAVDIIAVADLKTGFFTKVNPAFSRIIGYSQEEILNTPFMDFLHPDDRDKTADVVADELASDDLIPHFENRYRCKDGSYKWIAWTSNPIPEEGITFATGRDITALKDIEMELESHRQHLEGLVDERTAELKRTNEKMEEDITERKQAEEALKASEARYQDLYENAPDMYVSVDPNTAIILRCNQTVATNLGYTKREIVGRPIFDMYHLDCVDDVKRGLQSFVEAGQIQNVELQLKRKDGTKIDVLLNTSAVRDDQGNILYSRSAWRDITKRKQAEEALEKSEERFRTSIENMLDCFGIYSAIRDESGRIVDFRVEYVNAAACQANLLTKEEQIGNRLLELLPAHKDTGLFDEYCRVVKTGKPLVRESQIYVDTYGKKHLSRAFDIRVVKLGDGLAAAWRDVTEHKQAEDALRESEERFRKMFDDSRIGMLLADREGRFIQVNRSMTEIVGYSQQELLSISAVDITYPGDITSGDQIFQRLWTGESNGFSAEKRYIHKNGHVIWGAIAVSPIRDFLGETVFTVGQIQDITEHKQAEAEFQKVEKLKSVGTLAGGIAHDFNNILTGIMGNISLAMRYVEPKSKAADRLLEAEKASIRAKDLTQQLLTFAAGGAPIKKTLSITELIKDSTTFALRGSNVRCQFSLPEDLRQIEADEGQMNQVVTNLVINADEAMPEGGILNIGAKNTDIKRRSALTLPKGKYVEITIEDHGVGMKKEHLDRVFEPYFTTKQKGSGLGLATTYSIIKNHGGHITVKSELGFGTTFYIYLPASRKPIPKKEEEAVQAAFLGRGRILVMDDEEIIRELLYQELADVGYEVKLTKDGAEAIEQYTKAEEAGQPFDTVILDLTIPGGMGGKEAMERLLEIDPNVKAIVSSGYATDPVMANFKEYGFSAVVTKPYGVADLEKILRSILKAKK